MSSLLAVLLAAGNVLATADVPWYEELSVDLGLGATSETITSSNFAQRSDGGPGFMEVVGLLGRLSYRFGQGDLGTSAAVKLSYVDTEEGSATKLFVLPGGNVFLTLRPTANSTIGISGGRAVSFEPLRSDQAGLVLSTSDTARLMGSYAIPSLLSLGAGAEVGHLGYDDPQRRQEERVTLTTDQQVAVIPRPRLSIALGARQSRLLYERVSGVASRDATVLAGDLAIGIGFRKADSASLSGGAVQTRFPSQDVLSPYAQGALNVAIGSMTTLGLDARYAIQESFYGDTLSSRSLSGGLGLDRWVSFRTSGRLAARVERAWFGETQDTPARNDVTVTGELPLSYRFTPHLAATLTMAGRLRRSDLSGFSYREVRGSVTLGWSL